MRLVDKATGRELREGDEIKLRRGSAFISLIEPSRKRVFLAPADDGKPPFCALPGDFGAEFKLI